MLEGAVISAIRQSLRAARELAHVFDILPSVLESHVFECHIFDIASGFESHVESQRL